MRWKIINKEKAKTLCINYIPSGILSISLGNIPRGMSIEEFIDYIQKEKIVLKEN